MKKVILVLFAVMYFTLSFTVDAMELHTPGVTKTELVDGVLRVECGSVDSRACELQWELFDAKKNKRIEKGSSFNPHFYIYDVNKRKAYYLMCRVMYVDTNDGILYSDWSEKHYFISQPEVISNMDCVKKSKITIKWKKVQGAKSYTVYARKRKTKKWIKIKTTAKCAYTIKKVGKKKIDTGKHNYDICIVSNMKTDAGTVSSYLGEYCYTYR